MHLLLRHVAIVLCVIGCATTADARATRIWSYEDLAKAADLVVVMEPLFTEEVEDSYPGPLLGYKGADFQGLNTTFQVQAVLKGDVSLKRLLVVLHFAYSKNVRFLINGARFAAFLPGPLSFRKQVLQDGKEVGGVSVFKETPAWLAFLRKRDDGRYEAVTGSCDAVDSFRELHGASFYTSP
jgi:hypothetical protein